MADATIPKSNQSSDILIAVGVIVIILMLIIPLPDIFLDILLALNLMGAIIILLSVMFIKSTTDFTVFPSLLLISTVFRLAINVSSTSPYQDYGVILQNCARRF